MNAITDSAPFASTDAVTQVMERYRETGFGGAAITPELLDRMNIGAEVARRVVLTLRTLGLIGDDDKPTKEFIAYKEAPTSEYKQVFAANIYDVYAPVFAVLGQNLDTKTMDQIEDAFRPFKPDSLRKRMVALFVGLCEYAGIVAAAPTRKTGRPAGRQRSASDASMPARKPNIREVAAPRATAPKPPPPAPTPAPPGATTRKVTLRSGGEVAMTVSVDLFNLSTEDREFVLGLVDKLRNYENQRALPAGATPDKEDTS
jgi:hypothetical protein